MKKASISKKVLALTLSLSMTVSGMALGMATKNVYAKAKGKVTGISVTNLPAKTLTLKKGKSKVLKVGVKVSRKGVSKAYTFQSSKPKVVKVSKKGKNILVKAKKKGKATITVKSKTGKKKTAIKVTVGTPVSKVTLNKKRAQINKGQTVRLTAKVATKKASNRKIVWKSSNKKVATVTKKGVVKGLRAGRAKITAYAADGSGKKKTCIVTVTEAADITDVKSVQVLNAYSIRVTLSKAQLLTAKNFTVKTKSYDRGTFNKTYAIDNVTTGDKKVYDIVLDSSSYIEAETYLQVSVSGLSGVKGVKTVQLRYEKPKQNLQRDFVYKAEYNEEVEEDIYLGGYGYSKIISVNGLPKGIMAKISDGGNYVNLYGKSTVKGRYNATITTQDELGNTEKINILYLVGADDQIAAGFTTVRGVMGSESFWIDQAVSVAGGSGIYTYEIVGNNYGLSIDGEYVAGNLNTAGKYNVTVKVTDEMNTNLTTTATLTIDIKQGFTITGVIKDASGNPIPYADVVFENKNESDLYCSSRFTTANDKGVYSAQVISGTYDVNARMYSTAKYLYGVKITAARSGLNITMPVYKVTVTSGDSSVADYDFNGWEDTNGNIYGYGSTLYLKAGSYNLTTRGTEFMNRFTARIIVNVTKAQTVKATISRETESIAGTITAGISNTISVTDNYKYYKFMPTQSGYYTFYSIGDCDSYATLYNDKGEQLMYNDDDDGSLDFSMDVYCTAGSTYYLAVAKYDSGAENIVVYVEKQ